MLGGVVRGDGVTLRTTAEADLADHLRWNADFDATKWMSRRPWPQSLEQRKEWLKETAKDQALFHWELDAGGRHVGYCSARLEWPPMSEAWSIETLFVSPDVRAGGIGRATARALHRYLVDYLGLVRGEVWLYRDDAVGRALAESLGYVEIAHGRDVFFRDGRYWDDWRGMLRAAEFRRRFPDEVEYAQVPRAQRSAR